MILKNLSPWLVIFSILRDRCSVKLLWLLRSKEGRGGGGVAMGTTDILDWKQFGNRKRTFKKNDLIKILFCKFFNNKFFFK